MPVGTTQSTPSDATDQSGFPTGYNTSWADDQFDREMSYKEKANEIQAAANKATTAQQKAALAQQAKQFAEQLAFDRWKAGETFDLQKAQLDFQRWTTGEELNLRYGEQALDRWRYGQEFDLRKAALAQDEEQFKRNTQLKLVDLARERDALAVTQGRAVADAWYQQKQVELAYLNWQLGAGQLGLDFMKTAVELQSQPENWAKLADFSAGARERRDVPVYLQNLQAGAQAPTFQAPGANPTPNTVGGVMESLGGSAAPVAPASPLTAQQFTGTSPGLTQLQQYQLSPMPDYASVVNPSNPEALNPNTYQSVATAPSTQMGGGRTPVPYDPARMGLAYDAWRALPKEERQKAKEKAGYINTVFYTGSTPTKVQK